MNVLQEIAYNKVGNRRRDSAVQVDSTTSRRSRLRKTSFQKEKAEINMQTQNKIAADNKDLRATLNVNQIEIVSK